MNQWESQKYQLSVGSRGQIVRVVKQLLHENPRTNYQKDGTDFFDSKLQSAVAQFQQVSRFGNADGSLDVETWAALGKTVSDIRLYHLTTSVTESALWLLLNGNTNFDDYESLPKDQKKLAKQSFENVKKLAESKELKKTCQENVFDKLKTLGFDLAKYSAYLKKGAEFYDGEKSQADFNKVFGNNFAGGTLPPQIKTVSDFYLKAKGPTTGLPPNIFTSVSLSEKKLTVFFNLTLLNSNKSAIDDAVIFHESLHGYGSYINSGKLGKYTDAGLLTLFGFPLSDSSDKITDYLRDNCFK